MEKFLKLALIVLIPVVLWFTTPPDGLTDTAWRLLGFYIAGIVGLILKPYPIQIILLAVLSASALFLDNAKDILVGYGSTALWMIIAAFSLSVAFGKTGLGHRVAYHLINAFGSTVLRLGYVTALLDLVLSPATPSNTARAAGIVYPINLSIAESIGSYPGDTAKRGGSFILMNGYFVTKITSFMFLTAMAPNVLALDFVTKITGLNMTWAEWALALALPGLVMLIFVPLVGYWIDRPEAVKIDNKKLAADGLAKLGPMKMSEKILAVVFILALIGFLVSMLVKWEVQGGGSGIPQVNGEVKGYINPSWWRVILVKLFGGTASVFSGLSLGREGPSVQLGGMAAKGVARFTKADKTTELRMISCGAGAGMAAAFNAPLAGTMFVLEEIHHTFDKSLLCMGIVSSITALSLFTSSSVRSLTRVSGLTSAFARILSALGLPIP